MNKSVDKAVEIIGDYVNGQITITWNTRQTAEQYVEVRAMSGEPEEFDFEEFVEYVKSNTSEIIDQLKRSDIEEMLFVVNQFGEEVEDNE